MDEKRKSKRDDLYYTFSFELPTQIIIKIPIHYGNIDKCVSLAERLEIKVRKGKLGAGCSNNFGINIPIRTRNGLEQLECRCIR